jgi:hypothetical protein
MLAAKGLLKDKRVMPFFAGLKRAVEAAGNPAPLDLELKFHELDTLQANMTYVRRELSSYSYIGRDLQIIRARDVTGVDQPIAGVSGEVVADAVDVRLADAALPGQPSYRIV